MSIVRYDVFSVNMGKNTVRNMPKLQSLPPTSDSCNEKVKRVHIQACIWRNALDPDHPNLDPTNFGWNKNPNSKALIPTTIPEDKPPCVVKLICSGCASQQPCAKTKPLHCGSCMAHLPCTIFFRCHQTCNCRTRWTKDADELLYDADGDSSGSDSEDET